MPIIKTTPLTIATSVSLASSATSGYYGIDVSDYFSVGLDYAMTINSSATGTVYLKIYGCNDSSYSSNTKFHIMTMAFSPTEPNAHISLKCLEYRNLAIKVVNGSNYSLTFGASIVGVRLS